MSNYSIQTRIQIRTFAFALVTIFSLGLAAIAQSANPAYGSSSKPKQVREAEHRIKDVTSKSGSYFKQGLYNLVNENSTDARRDFDKSVEVFLLSGISIKRNESLRDCYNKLVETIYRMEFPDKKQPANVRSLSIVCGWGVKDDLSAKVSKFLASTDSALTIGTRETTDQLGEQATAQIGFSQQKFEPSPLDELAKLELNEEETNVDTPEAQQEYEYIKVAVEKNRSLGFSFQMHRLVQQFINYYRGRGRRTMEVGLYRSGMFMSMARRIFREEGVPENIAWLAQVESAWKPTAHSWAAAAGLWQFIPATGSRYGLRRTGYLDERQSFEKATRASARYLKFLARRYGGSWELAMAGYNCGEGNVDRAIRKAGRSNFWAAYPYLPRETRKYVPNILAVVIIANNPSKYGFGHVRPATPLRYDRVRVPASTNLKTIAQAVDSSTSFLRYLNPELRTNRTPPEPYVVRVPARKSGKVVALFKKMKGNKAARISNSQRGESWENIARQTGVSVAELRKANPGMVKPTGKVIVPLPPGVTVTSYARPSGARVARVKPRTIRVKKGDSVKKVAARYKVNLAELAKFNGLRTTTVFKTDRDIKLPPKMKRSN